MDEPKPQVKLQSVEATMSSPIFHAEALETAAAVDFPSDVQEVPERPEASAPPRIAVPRRVEFEVGVVAAIAVVATYFAADARVAIVAGSLGLAAIAFRRIDRRVPFSFGEGFIGYRGDPGWPQGVQEDDDVHWNWRASAASGRRP